MKFRKKLSVAAREQVDKSRMHTLEMLIEEQRQQIADLRKIVRHQRRQLGVFLPPTGKVLEQCDACGRPTKVLIKTVTAAAFVPCGKCGQQFSAPLMVQSTVAGIGQPYPAGLGAASAIGEF